MNKVTMSGLTAIAAREPTTTDKLRFLQDASHLGEPGARVECIETHFAWVFLVPGSAYKLRKPVRFRGIDTLGLGSRLARCMAELRLNQPLAPDVYLEVLPLTIGLDGRLRLGAGARIVDWLLHMRRLPQARMLDVAIRCRTLKAVDLAALSAHLDGFYARQAPVPMTGENYCSRLQSQVEHNRDELLQAGSLGVDIGSVPQTSQLQQRWIEANADLLHDRAEQGWIRDCHGDLKPEHVCLGPPVNVIDRLDIDADLRLLDPVEDLCFLWLECARLGASGTGRRLVKDYMAASRAPVAKSLARFYLSHRALTRARLGAWRLAEPDAQRAGWHERVHDYLARASAAIRTAAREPLRG